jgi:hypothetical protein
MVVPAACPVQDAGAAAVAGEAAADGAAIEAARLAGEAAGEPLAAAEVAAEGLANAAAELVTGVGVAAAGVTSVGVTAGTALLLVTGLEAALVTAGAPVPADPEVAEADPESCTLRVFWLSTVIGA